MPYLSEPRPREERGAWLALAAIFVLSVIGGAALFVALKLVTWWLDGLAP